MTPTLVRIDNPRITCNTEFLCLDNIMHVAFSNANSDDIDIQMEDQIIITYNTGECLMFVSENARKLCNYFMDHSSELEGK